MAEAKLNGTENIWKVLQYLNRKESPSREGILDYMFILLTRGYGFNRVAFYEADPYKNFAKPVLVMGPDNAEEHARIEPITANLSLDTLLETDRLGNVEERTSPFLEKKFKSYNVPLNEPSRFENSFVSENSHFGKDTEGYQLTEIDKKIGEIFGTDDYALITVKGAKGKVIGWFYVDYKFSRKSLFDEEGQPVIDKENIRHIVELTSSYLQIVRAYEAAIEYERLSAMQESLRRVAHEIREPLSATIGGYARRILNCLKDEKWKKDKEKWIEISANVILETVDRLMVLVNGIREASKKIEPNPSKLNIYGAVSEGIESLMIENRREYSLIRPETDLSVYADPMHAKAVTINLANNALDAIAGDFNKRGPLSVNFSFDNASAYIHFNNPQNISPDVLPRIFEPYFTTKKQGLGLGLSICLGYMRANSGNLTVESSPEKGTTFTMKLPLYKGQDKKQA